MSEREYVYMCVRKRESNQDEEKMIKTNTSINNILHIEYFFLSNFISRKDNVALWSACFDLWISSMLLCANKMGYLFFV